ncbi:AraC family transcriptional regulator [Undibacterium terreum]|uniref:AraC family transcriptional regulator n=1 Tax=Undibacterium terreum TaxID=1224302 RepID=UPI00166E990F|nr:helix-turn-helix domain-containing protein [Undibacterium terreum]
MNLHHAGGTHAAVHAPRLSLGSCIRAYITRSTRDVALLPANSRLNHFPPSSVCTISWYLHGEAELIQIGDKAVAQVLPVPIIFNGPRTEAVVSYNPGQVEVFTLVLLPEALHALTGLNIAEFTDRSLAFAQVFDTEWQAMAQAVLNASGHAERIALIEEFIEPRWAAARPHSNPLADWMRGSFESMAVRMAASHWVRSGRQLERQVKMWSGLSYQRLWGLRRAENRFIAVREMLRSSDSSWADVAATTGHADQAHFCRETRKITGLSPKELKRRVMEEESYWLYRIWS